MKENHQINPNLNEINMIENSFKMQILNQEEILEKLYMGVKNIFHFSDVSIYLLTSDNHKVSISYPARQTWPIPDLEREWLIKQFKDLPPDNNDTMIIQHIPKRKTFFYTNKTQLKQDIEKYQYDCNDALFILMISNDRQLQGIIFASNWSKKESVWKRKPSKKILMRLSLFLQNGVKALDNLLMHQKIKNLMSDKKMLKQRIKKDEEDLNRRILELTVLYDTSNLLGNSLNHLDILRMVMASLNKVLHFDICGIFIADFTPNGELLMRINTPIKKKQLNIIKKNMLNSIMPFTQSNIDIDNIQFIIENFFSTKMLQTDADMKSYANVPLIFKDDVYGLLNVCSINENAFSRNEITFLHTMANQLSSHLGRLKIIKDLEKSKISSLIQSMTESIIMLGPNHNLEIINTAASILLNGKTKLQNNEKLILKFKEIGLYSLYLESIKKNKEMLNQELIYDDKVLSTNISPVQDVDGEHIGTVIVLNDVTEIQKINKVKAERLTIISKVERIISSISNLDRLLEVLMDFILTVAKSEMGSIQLKKEKKIETKVHSNFPDKIRQDYRFLNGETISDHTEKQKETVYIEHYFRHPDVNPNSKILIDSYLCIPIIVNSTLIGLINIIRKFGNTEDPFTADDLVTLQTITSLSGASIHNSILYKKNVEQKTLEQELKVANSIQKRLLPSTLPELSGFNFGAFSQPAREIGGDYYDFFEFPDGRIGIVIADIVGKGIPAGLFMAMLKTLLRTNIRPDQSPKEALSLINSQLCTETVINKFVPVFYAILTPSTHQLVYSNAGHEPPMLFSEGTFRMLDTIGFPLGGENDTQFEEKELLVKNEDVILFFTDGITEARNNKGTLFGAESLFSIIRSHHSLSAPALAQKIYDNVKNFCQDNSPQDDITMVILKVSEPIQQEDTNPLLKTASLTVKSTIPNIKKVRRKVEKIASEMGFDSSDIFSIKLAVNEAHANVIEHAYGGRKDGKIVFKFLTYKDKLVISIVDFAKHSGQKTTKGENDLGELEGSGLGLFLINNTMDKIHQTSAANETTLELTKYLKK